METLLTIMLGIMIGVIITMIFLPRIADGVLYVANTSDPNYAAAGVEFHKGANEILKQRIVILRVHTHK